MGATCQLRKGDSVRAFTYFVHTWLRVVCLLDWISAGRFLWYFVLSESIIPLSDDDDLRKGSIVVSSLKAALVVIQMYSAMKNEVKSC